jgi:hypothetical protein
MTSRWPCLLLATLCCLLAVATSASAGHAWGLWLRQAWNEEGWWGSRGEEWGILRAYENQLQCEIDLRVYLTRRYAIEQEKKENQGAMVEYLPSMREPIVPYDTVHIRKDRPRPHREEWFTYICLPDTVDPRGPKGK